MSIVMKFFDRLWASFENLERTRREAWLAQSTDVYELESRIRELERHASRGAF
jgi:hypothetical protein